MRLKITQEAIDWFFGRDFGEYTPFADMDKARKICDMRLNGKQYRDIGAAVGLSPDRVRCYVARVQNTYERMLKREEFERRRKEKGIYSLQDISKMVEMEFEKAKRCNHIQKPMAYALHQVWKRVDGKEKPRC